MSTVSVVSLQAVPIEDPVLPLTGERMVPGVPGPLHPFHTRELDRSELATLRRGVGFAGQALHGLHHGPRLRALDAAHVGSLVDAQLAVAQHGGGWPQRLGADVASVQAGDFELHERDPERSLDLVAVAVRA